MDQTPGRLGAPADESQALRESEAEIARTRDEMSETLEAIQAKLAPERLTEDAKETAIETVDHLVDEVKTTAQELSEITSVAAMEAVDHALEKLREALPELREQLQSSARGASELASVAAMEAVDHALAEAKAAVRDLGDQAKAAVRDATIGRVERMANTTTQSTKSMSTTIAQTVKQNPGPAALTALGVGWLVASGRSAGQTATASPSMSSDQSTGGITDTASAAAGQVQETAGQAVDAAGQVLGSAADQASQAATGAAQAATGVAGSVADGVVQGTGAVASTVQQTVVGAGSQVKAAPSRLRQMVDENPMRLGVIAMAVGSLAALAFPGSQREQELLGGARDTLVDKAQTTAASTIEKVQQVAEEVGETVEKEARYQGLTGEDR
jgi:hypothetical protein